MDKTIRGVVSAAVEQSRRKANMVAQGDGKFGPWGWPQDPSKPKKRHMNPHKNMFGSKIEAWSVNEIGKKNVNLMFLWKKPGWYREARMGKKSEHIFWGS